MKRRLDLSHERVRAIAPGQFVRVALPQAVWMPDGNLAASVIVGRSGDALVAYANICRHQPVPLDAGGTPLVAPDGTHLLCQSHGALYRPSDGFCVAGPCEGQSLFAARVVTDDAGVGVEL